MPVTERFDKVKLNVFTDLLSQLFVVITRLAPKTGPLAGLITRPLESLDAVCNRELRRFEPRWNEVQVMIAASGDDYVQRRVIAHALDSFFADVVNHMDLRVLETLYSKRTSVPDSIHGASSLTYIRTGEEVVTGTSVVDVISNGVMIDPSAYGAPYTAFPSGIQLLKFFVSLYDQWITVGFSALMYPTLIVASKHRAIAEDLARFQSVVDLLPQEIRPAKATSNHVYDLCDRLKSSNNLGNSELIARRCGVDVISLPSQSFFNSTLANIHPSGNKQVAHCDSFPKLCLEKAMGVAVHQRLTGSLSHDSGSQMMTGTGPRGFRINFIKRAKVLLDALMMAYEHSRADVAAACILFDTPWPEQAEWLQSLRLKPEDFISKEIAVPAFGTVCWDGLDFHFGARPLQDEPWTLSCTEPRSFTYCHFLVENIKSLKEGDIIALRAWLKFGQPWYTFLSDDNHRKLMPQDAANIEKHGLKEALYTASPGTYVFPFLRELYL
jgi:hypothetical protein